MATERKPKTGILLPNKYKKAPSAPDYVGTFITEDGKEQELVGWKKTSKNGFQFIVIAYTEKTKIKQKWDIDPNF